MFYLCLIPGIIGLAASIAVFGPEVVLVAGFVGLLAARYRL